MRNLHSFRSGYIIIIPIIAFIGIGIAYLLLCKSILTINEFIQLLVAIVALGISLIAIAISDKKTPKLDFKVTLWANKGHIKGRDTPSIHYKVSIKLENKSKFPLVNPVVSIRLPSWIIDFNMQEKDNSFELFKFGNTSVVTTPVLRFLNTKEHITIELYLKLVSGKQFNLSCSMISDGVIHKTEKYKAIDTDELLKFTSNVPYPIEGKITYQKDLLIE